MRSASRNLALSRSRREGARCSCLSSLRRISAAICASTRAGIIAQPSAMASVRMLLGLKAAAGAGARMNGEGYTQIPLSLHPMDDRFRALDAWLRSVLPRAALRIEAASPDASFPRYFRGFLEDRPPIAMDAPPAPGDS